MSESSENGAAKTNVQSLATELEGDDPIERKVRSARLGTRLRYSPRSIARSGARRAHCNQSDAGGGQPGTIVLDERAARALAEAAFRDRAPRGVSDVDHDVRTSFDKVCVTVTGRVEYIFSKAIPGGRDGRIVTGRAVATAVQGDDQSRVHVQTGDVCGP